MSELTHATWVLVADGEKALLLENVGDEAHPHLQVRRKEIQDNPAAGKQGTDAPGRFNDGPNAHRSAVDDTDWHQLNKHRFADELAELLYGMAHRDRFDRLIVTAAPKVLGALRQKWHKEVAHRIVLEIDKDLTAHPVDEIETLIGKTA